jgi:hypothetical protein
MDVMMSSSVVTVLPSSDRHDDIIILVPTKLPCSEGHDDVMIPVATVVHL